MSVRIALASLLAALGAATIGGGCGAVTALDDQDPCDYTVCDGPAASAGKDVPSGSGGAGAGGPDALVVDGHIRNRPGTCKYVDVLFVVDNSGTMSPYHAGLASAFPSFADAMSRELPGGTDVHVGITTTSFFTGSCSEKVSNCKTTATKAEVEAHYVTPSQGTTTSNGEQGRLFEYMGKNFYATTTGQSDPQLTAWFGGAALATGELGCAYEVPSAAAAYAVHPDNAAHNAGFLRDEGGVLLIVVVTDEPDKSPEGVSTYANMLISAKQGCGGAGCIMTAALLAPCVKNFGDPLWELLTSFPPPTIWGDLANPSAYPEVLGDNLAQVVARRCDEVGSPD
jgi:hypothetical protein